VDSYPYPTEIITTFYFLSDFGATIGGYPNIVLMISYHIFFFSKKMACNLSVSAFMAKVLNSIIKFAIFCFSCLKVLIFHLAFSAFVLSLNVILISLTNSFQSWVSSSSSSSSLGVNICYTFPETSQNHCDPIIGLYNSITLKE